jgi:hypothetical protein
MRFLAWVFLLPLLLATPPAGADPAATVEGDLAACRRLVEGRSWRAAAEAYRKLFAEWPGDPALIAALPDIEDDLRRVHYRLEVPEPTAADLYGPAVKSFDPTTLKLALHWPSLPEGKLWSEVSGSVWALLVRFEGRVTVSFRFPSESLGVLLCYSLEKSGGYVVVPNRPGWDRRAESTAVLSIERLDDGRRTLLAAEAPYAPSAAERPIFPKRFEVRRDLNAVTAWGDRKMLAKATDSRYRGGYVGFLGARPKDVRIEGVVEEKFHRQRAGEWDDARFREWQAKEWKPAEVLPPWTREHAPTGAAPTAPLLPSDADLTRADPREIAALAERVLSGDAGARRRLLIIAVDQPLRTRVFLAALAGLAAGYTREADEGFSNVLKVEPDHAMARALRGFARLHLRRIDEARADFDEAIRLAPGLPLAHRGRMELALLEGDLDGAAAAVGGAGAGLGAAPLEELRTLVQRARRGPLFTRHFEAATARFVVRTDHSTDLAREVARILEDSLLVYAKAFPQGRAPARKSRVWLFASEQGYLAYAGDVMVELAGSAGAYDPRLRELVLFLPDDRSRFVHTIRHEGFHRYMHEFIDDPPIWFAEGCAEYFSSGRELGGGAFATGARIPEYVERLLDPGASPTPLADLFVMWHSAFMEAPALHYAQSWAVVHYLLHTKETALASVFRDYQAALREGVGAEEAFERVLEPVTERIERALPAWLRSLRD